MAERRYWLGGAPTHCDTCGAPIREVFYDAATSLGAWANMCPSCHHFGPGLGKLGTGQGQEYTHNPKDGKYYKTGG